MKKTMTAEEFLAQLQQDPTWSAQQREAAKREALFTKEFSLQERPILEKLAEVGFDVASLGNVAEIGDKLPLPASAVQVLLACLSEAHWRVQESIVRLLAAVNQRFDGRVLADLFDDTLRQDTEKMPTEQAVALGQLRWAIGNTIASARPLGVSDWLRERILDRRLGRSKEMLLIAAARILDPRNAIDLIVPHFEEFPAQCALALAECGGESELNFLREGLSSVQGETAKEMARAIRRLEARLNEGTGVKRGRSSFSLDQGQVPIVNATAGAVKMG